MMSGRVCLIPSKVTSQSNLEKRDRPRPPLSLGRRTVVRGCGGEARSEGWEKEEMGAEKSESGDKAGGEREDACLEM